MSEELFEVAFEGKIVDEADLQQVKAKVGAMFKADAAKLEQLFSGKRVVIKKNINQATANKYKAALSNAGAVCEIKSLSGDTSVAAASQEKAAEMAKPVADASRQVISGDVPEAPMTDPLGITADDISELSASLAPVGSQVQDEIPQVAEPELDISQLDMAPVGSDMGEMKKKEAPPPPDTSGLSLKDD